MIESPESRSVTAIEKRPAVRVLVVDDNVQVLQTMAEMLRILDYRVETAYSGHAAMEKFSLLPVDIVVTDYDMPKMDGLQLSAWIKEKSPDTRVIIITGRMDFDAKFHIGNALIDDCLHKPFLMRELHEKVSENLRNHRDVGLPAFDPADGEREDSPLLES